MTYSLPLRCDQCDVQLSNGHAGLCAACEPPAVAARADVWAIFLAIDARHETGAAERARQLEHDGWGGNLSGRPLRGKIGGAPA